MQKQDIVKQKFSRAFRGYDIAEVDVFLDAVIAELERREQERAALAEQLELAQAALAQYQPARPAAQDMAAYDKPTDDPASYGEAAYAAVLEDEYEDVIELVEETEGEPV